jgi:hypothetical protein
VKNSVISLTKDRRIMNFEAQNVKNTLFRGKALVEFVKTNGEKRSMICTLKPELIPEKTENENPKRPKQENPDVQPVWDLEKSAWRSFRFDSLTNIIPADQM